MKRQCIFISIIVLVCSTSLFAFTGNGTASDPYLIYTKEDLTDDLFVHGFIGEQHVKLMDDIDFEGESCPRLFMSFGLMGVFDGNGKSILNAMIEQDGLIEFDTGVAVLKNLTLVNPSHAPLGGDARVCFFSNWFRKKTTIENCHIINGVIQLPVLPLSSSNSFAAGFTRMNEGVIRKCTFQGIVEATTSAGLALRNYRDGIIEDCHADIGILGGYTTGGLVAYNDGIVRGCSSEGTVENFGTDWAAAGGLIGNTSGYDDNDEPGIITNCRSSCNVKTGGKLGGGLIGSGYGGLIINCSASGSVEGYSYLGGFIGSFVTTMRSTQIGVIENCYSTGSVSGNNRIGGFIGESGSSLVSNCYSTGSATGARITGGFMGTNYVYPYDGYGQALVEKCYSTGKVTAGAESGGLIGRHWGQPVRVTNSFWDSQSSGWTISSGGSGMTTEQMKTANTFIDAGWDFIGEDSNGGADSWRLCLDGVGYPHLSYQHILYGDFACPDGTSIEDMAYLAANWLATGLEPYTGADCTGDGTVNIPDFSLYAKNAKHGLVAHWPFDADGSDIANNNDASFMNGAYITTTEGEFMVGVGGAGFDGIDDYITANSVCSIIAGKDLTFCVWIRSGLTSANKFLSAFNTVSGGNRFLLGQQGANANLMMYDNGWQDSGAVVFDGTWHHAAFVLSVEADIMTLYVDGVSAHTYSTKSMIEFDDVFSLGQEYDSGMTTGDFCNGLIDDVRIYNIALSAEEIDALATP